MNQKFPYEQTIAQKLELLPVPDMEAAIWKRIEFQLDMDKPAGGANEGTKPPISPTPNPVVLGGISIVFLAALLLYTILTNKQPITHQPSAPVNTQSPISQPGLKNSSPPGSKNKPMVPLKKPAAASPIQIEPDAVSEPPVLPGNKNLLNEDRGDVIIIPPVQSPKQEAPTVNDSPEKKIKKKRGVQGISDDDYRIVPKQKDSLP